MTERSEDSLAIDVQWLGQAGFLLSVPGSRAVAIDPYLSDECDRIYGLSRVGDAPISSSDLDVDLLLISHWHEDHLDLPSVKAAREHGGVVVAPPSVLARVRNALGDGDDLIDAIPGESITLRGTRVDPVIALHRVPGYITEDAVGFVVDFAGTVLYHSGDTEYSRGIVESIGRHLDLALLCINGSGGNMNCVEAAALASQLDVDILVPMHFGLWDADAYGPGATLDPRSFATVARAIGVTAQVIIPVLGEILASEGDA